MTTATKWRTIGAAALVGIFSGATAFAADTKGDVSNAKIAFLMPDEGSTRYEEHDRPRLRRRDEEAVPRMYGALSERRCRRLEATAAIQLRYFAGGESDRHGSGRFDGGGVAR